MCYNHVYQSARDIISTSNLYLKARDDKYRIHELSDSYLLVTATPMLHRIGHEYVFVETGAW
jgi:hypothetical protein